MPAKGAHRAKAFSEVVGWAAVGAGDEEVYLVLEIASSGEGILYSPANLGGSAEGERIGAGIEGFAHAGDAGEGAGAAGAGVLFGLDHQVGCPLGRESAAMVHIKRTRWDLSSPLGLEVLEEWTLKALAGAGNDDVGLAQGDHAGGAGNRQRTACLGASNGEDGPPRTECTGNEVGVGDEGGWLPGGAKREPIDDREPARIGGAGAQTGRLDRLEGGIECDQ